MAGVNVDHMLRFCRAIMIICGADGGAEAEWGFYANGARTFGLSEDLLDELRNFDYRSARLEDYLAGWPPGNMPRAMLYMAIRTASIDGYHEKERAAMAHAAKLLGVDPGILAALEHIAESEIMLMVTNGRLIGE